MALAAAGLAFTGGVRHVKTPRDLSGRIGDDRLGQRRHCFGAEAGLERQRIMTGSRTGERVMAR